VTFSAEHELLVAIDEHDSVIGGLCFRLASASRAHLDKIVVHRNRRGKGVSDGLMHELLHRLRDRGVRAVGTGYFRPEYLRRFGFRTAPHSGGLVRDLSEPIEWRGAEPARAPAPT
jgi:N-acetylglutamate synthase-like GNAT family acetyltransferase